MQTNDAIDRLYAIGKEIEAKLIKADKYGMKSDDMLTSVNDEALHPGRLRQILVDEIERYYDADLDDQIEDIAREVQSDLNDTNTAAAAPFQAELRELAGAYAELEKRTKALYQGIEDNLHEADDIDNVEWPEPKAGDEDPDPLYDSKRTYVEQIDHYKAHQGKPITRKDRKVAIRTGRAA